MSCVLVAFAPPAAALGSQTITFTSNAPTDVTYGDGSTYTPTATATSGDPVTFSIDSTSTSACSIDSSGVVSFTAAGTCIIDADQAGDANYAPAPQVQQSVDVAQATQAITFTSPAPTDVTYGDGSTYTPTATATSGDPVTFWIDSTSTSACSIDSSGVVSFTGAGACLIDANQAGNSDYTAAPQVQQSVAIAKAAQAITFTSTAPTNATVGGATYTPTATGGNSGQPVVFSIDSSSTPGACSVSSGVVSFTAAGACLIDANQAGNSDYTAAPQVRQTVSVAGAAQTLSFSTSAPTNATVGTTYTPAATGGNSGNPVVLTIDSTASSVCSIGGSGVVSFTAVGICVIDANQAGNTHYLAAPQLQQSITVGKASQTISFTSTAPASATVNGATYTPTATGGASGNPVVFTLGPASTAGACSVSSGVVSFTGSGTCVIEADQAGNADYLAAPQAQQTIAVEVLTSDTTLMVTASTLTVSVTGAGPSPTGTVTFSVNGRVVGTVQLDAGSATLEHAFAAGQTYAVSAQYSGDGVYAKSSAARTYRAPSTPTPPAPLRVRLKLSSSRPERAGWWTAPVTVSFICTRAGARVKPCRKPVRLTRSGRGQVVAGHRINIDLGAPTLVFGDLNAGATYLVSAPKPVCHAHDSVSGISGCSISEKVQDRAAGERSLTFTAKAVNAAGTSTVRSITVTEQQPGLIGRVASATGIYLSNKGRTYTVQVASKIKPLYLAGALAPNLPAGTHDFFSLTGHHQGTPLWELAVVLPTGLPPHSYWNIGIQIGGRTQIFAIPD